MERTVRFKWLEKKKYWQVLVYKPGQGLQKPPYQIKIIGNVRGKYQAYCNCKSKWYRPNEVCVHEHEFYKYMQKQIDEGKVIN